MLSGGGWVGLCQEIRVPDRKPIRQMAMEQRRTLGGVCDVQEGGDSLGCNECE